MYFTKKIDQALGQIKNSEEVNNQLKLLTGRCYEDHGIFEGDLNKSSKIQLISSGELLGKLKAMNQSDISFQIRFIFKRKEISDVKNFTIVEQAILRCLTVPLGIVGAMIVTEDANMFCIFN